MIINMNGYSRFEKTVALADLGCEIM